MNIKTATRRHPYLSALAYVILILALMMAFAGCATPAASSPAPNASAAGEVVEEPQEQTPPPVNELIKQFGEVITYEDGVSISVGQPTPFTPTEYASGGDQANNVVFEFVITNGSTEPFDPMAYPTVSSGGVEASGVFDIDNPIGDLVSSPTTSILPGQTVKWLQGFSLADLTNITLNVAPGFEYETAIFTNIPF